jgi:hypothetical protein
LTASCARPCFKLKSTKRVTTRSFIELHPVPSPGPSGPPGPSRARVPTKDIVGPLIVTCTASGTRARAYHHDNCHRYCSNKHTHCHLPRQKEAGVRSGESQGALEVGRRCGRGQDEISSSDLDEMKLASRSTSRSKRRRSRRLKRSSRPARRPSKLYLIT